MANFHTQEGRKCFYIIIPLCKNHKMAPWVVRDVTRGGTSESESPVQKMPASESVDYYSKLRLSPPRPGAAAVGGERLSLTEFS
jgi:hypothetical protein